MLLALVALALGAALGLRTLPSLGAEQPPSPARTSAGRAQPQAQPQPQPQPQPGAAAPQPTIHAGPEGRVLVGPRWRYRADPGDVGIASGWSSGRFEARRVRVPHSPNAWPVSGAAGVRNYEGSVGWYRRALRVDRSGRYAIRFESAHHRATVWLNGELLGQHVGAYLPFEMRPRLRAGRTYRLVVRTDWRGPTDQKRAGWHRGWFNYGGLHREVTIRRIGHSELEAPNVQTVLGGPATADVTVAVRVHNRLATRRLAPEGTLTRAGQAVPIAFPAQEVPRGGRALFQARVRVDGAALWSPERPDLYDLRLTVPGESGYAARVGLREVRRREGMLELNGRRLFLRGASLHEDVRGHGDALTAADQDDLVGRLAQIGSNATRAQHPLHPALLERLDAAGILVWQEIGPWDSPGNWLEKTASQRRRSVGRVRESLEQLQTHPSILAWNLGNEVAWNGHPGQVEYVERSARELHRRDPGRLVALDLWGIHLPRRPGRMYRDIDAVGATNYIGWYEWTFARHAELRRRIRGRMARVRHLFPDKAVVATEFGAEGNRLNAPGTHGSMGYQTRLLRLNLQTYRALPDVSGMLIWNLQDFGVNPAFGGGSILRKVAGIRLVPGLNQKGLFDSRGRPKPAVDVVRREFERTRQERE